MGQVIEVDNHGGGTHPSSRRQEQGTVLRGISPRDRPAESYLEDDETPVFLLANGKRGVGIDREDGTEHAHGWLGVPDDRRPHRPSTGDSRRGQRRRVGGRRPVSHRAPRRRRRRRRGDRSSRGPTLRYPNQRWHAHALRRGRRAGRGGGVPSRRPPRPGYTSRNTLDDVQRSLVAATGHFDAGEYDAALEAAQEAYHGLNEPAPRGEPVRRRVDGSRVDRPRRPGPASLREHAGRSATVARPPVQRRRRVTLARRRVRGGPTTRSTMRARNSRPCSPTTPPPCRTGTQSTRNTTGSSASRPNCRQPRSGARSRRTGPPPTLTTRADAADHWDDALRGLLHRPGTRLGGADERRFEGDPDQLRDRLGEVVERLVSARRTAASKAKRAGDWYVGAEQYEVAVEEFEVAREQFTTSHSPSRGERYAGATDHLTVGTRGRRVPAGARSPRCVTVRTSAPSRCRTGTPMRTGRSSSRPPSATRTPSATPARPTGTLRRPVRRRQIVTRRRTMREMTDGGSDHRRRSADRR